MGKLTDRNLDSWMKRGTPISGISDGGGLTFTLSKAGTATWVFRYRYGGKQREVTVGNYPDLGLGDARRSARALRVKVDQGVDLASERREAKFEAARAGSFRILADDYLGRVGPALAQSTALETKRYIDKDIIPRIGSIPARKVTGADIVAMVERIAERSDAVARRAFEIVAVIFAHGVAKHVISSNPCAGLRLSAILGPRQTRRPRTMLSESDLAALMPALPGLGELNALAVKILLATCVRKSELLKARWVDVDLERALWVVRDENSKTRRGFTVPLAPTVVDWLVQLQAFARDDGWLLPGRRGRHMSRTTLNVALSRLGEDLPHFSPHDLRSTARSHLAKLGVNVVVAERCLNHSLGGLLAVYDKHDYMDERRSALDLWAGVLARAEVGKGGNVTSLRAAA